MLSTLDATVNQWPARTYLAFWCTSITVSNEERPQCVVCLKTLSSDSLNPNKPSHHEHKEKVRIEKLWYCINHNVSTKSCRKVWGKVWKPLFYLMVSSGKNSNFVINCSFQTHKTFIHVRNISEDIFQWNLKVRCNSRTYALLYDA